MSPRTLWRVRPRRQPKYCWYSRYWTFFEANSICRAISNAYWKRQLYLINKIAAWGRKNEHKASRSTTWRSGISKFSERRRSCRLTFGPGGLMVIHAQKPMFNGLKARRWSWALSQSPRSSRCRPLTEPHINASSTESQRAERKSTTRAATVNVLTVPGTLWEFKAVLASLNYTVTPNDVLLVNKVSRFSPDESG